MAIKRNTHTHLFWQECFHSMDDESNNGRRESEADRVHRAADVHGRKVRRSRHGQLDGTWKKNL